ncbi:EamA/RhaT family transporter [Flavobacteriaceae bacterium M23B6Z8]
MIYLVLSILINTLLFVIFKYFSQFKVNNLQAIVVNYFVAFSVGYFFEADRLAIKAITGAAWFPGTLFLGILFVTLFNILALTAQKGGLSVVSIASKMSLVIPVIFAFLVYGDKITLLKIGGIILALIAVYLVTKKTATPSVENKYLYLPVLLFFGSGLLDTVLKYIETQYVAEGETIAYSAAIFLIAGITGIVFLGIQSVTTKVHFESKSLIAGIILGVPNFFSIYFLLKALKMEGLESSYIFPVNNVGIVLVSTLTGVLIFKEHLTSINRIGILAAISAIILMSIEI